MWRTGSFTLAWLCAGLLIGPSGCERPSGSSASSRQGASAAPATQPSEADLAAVKRMVDKAGGLPPGHPPMNLVPSPNPSASGLPMDPAAEVKPLLFDAPAAWTVQEPANRIRRAQYAIPRAAGDEADGELAIFHFPGTGGPVEMNIERWIAQFSTSEGDPIDRAAVRRQTFDVGGLKVTVIDLAGYYSAGVMAGGTGARSAQQYRLLGAIVETPDGPWFFKGFGPEATMAAARDDFLTMVKSVRR